ncbi:hypothetical protein Syun_029024 [Stephania yunnanensis]|uniref:Uncharacterized protein n=1 Tax=Stephania yunnanensis TaxID=152371 RepID=A0AAP0E771_9MAGN
MANIESIQPTRRTSFFEEEEEEEEPRRGNGQVVILKRGESLDLKRKTENSVKRTVSDSIPKQIRIRDRTSSGDEYAGTAFFLSPPSPRALPLPSFSKKTQAAECAVAVHDSATKDLRRLLRLD